MMEEDERIRLLFLTLDELRACSERGVPIIVEGKKDVKALRALDLWGEVVHPSGGTISEFAERLARAHGEVVVLTDWDGTGERLCRMIARTMRAMGCKPDTRIRGRFKHLTGRECKDVECLYRLFEKLMESKQSKKL